VTHLNKNFDAKTPLHRITGSMAYGNLPRNVHFVVDNPDKPGQRLFKQAKCNNAPRDLPAIAFEIVTRMIPSPKGEIETCYPVFAAETVDVDLKEALSGGKSRGPAPTNTEKLARFLLEHLKVKKIDYMSAIAAAAGAAGLIGKPTIHKGRSSWTGFNGLYRAIEAIPTLPPPDDGFEVVTSKDDPTLRGANGRARWQLRKTGQTWGDVRATGSHPPAETLC
jgi:hypothetical protein